MAPSPRSRLILGVAAGLGLYLVAALLCFSPHNPFDANHLPDGGVGDPAQMTWFLAFGEHALVTGHASLETDLIDVPGGVNLAVNTSVPFLAVLTAPVTAAAGPVAAFNAGLRLALVASAGAMFLVLRRWCRSLVACFVGGLCFGFGPYVFSQAQGDAHLDLAFLALLPIGLLCVDDLLFTRRWHGEQAGALLGAVAAAQMLVAPEVLSDCVLIGLVGAVGLALFWRPGPDALRRALRGACVALVVFLVVCGYPLWAMLLGPGHLSGPVSAVAHLQFFRADLLEAVVPTARQLVAPAGPFAGVHFATKDLAEIGGYLSVPLVLAVAATVVALWRMTGVRALAGLMLVAWVGSLGSRLVVDGHTTALPLPEALLAHLPVLDDTVPARFAIEVALFATMLLAIGLDRVLTLAGTRTGRGRVTLLAATALGVLLVLVSIAPRVPVVETRLPWPGSLPGDIATHVGAGAVVLSYPYPSPPYDDAMVFQADRAFPYRLMGGYATVRSGSGGGQYWPPLLPPDGVQELLSHLEAGARSHYRAPEGSVSATTLCRFVARYGVTDAVVWLGAHGSAAASRFFEAALGPPGYSDGTVTVFPVAVPSRSGAADHC